MADQYFTAQPNSEHDFRVLQIGEMTFLTDAGTFSRDALDTGSDTLLRALPHRDGRCLDLGCGWGAVGLSMAKACPSSSWVLVDINERAAELSRRNAQRNGIANTSVLCQDGIGPRDGLFSLIATNPPVRTGKQNLFRLYDQCAEHLLPEGELFVVIRKKQGADSTRIYLQGLFGNCETVARHAGFHVLRSVKRNGEEPL